MRRKRTLQYNLEVLFVASLFAVAGATALYVIVLVVSNLGLVNFGRLL